MLESEIRTEKGRVYVFQGRTFLCPESSLKQGAIVILVKGNERVDPRGLYRFVIDQYGETHSVSKDRLKHIAAIEFEWTRKPFQTFIMEKEEIRKAACQALINEWYGGLPSVPIQKQILNVISYDDIDETNKIETIKELCQTLTC